MAELALSAATGAFGSSAVGTIASVGLTAASAFGSISEGNQEAASLRLQARQAELNARSERLEGKRQAVLIQEQLKRDLASQNAIFEARGIISGEGSAAAAAAVSKERANQDIDIARFNSDIAALNSEQRASNARSNARSSRQQGILSAASTIGSFKRPSLIGGSDDQ